MASIRPIAKGKNKKPLGIVIGVGNQKGGVGKSTNTVHIAAALGLKGYRTLIIDLDPTAGATKLLGVEPDEFAGTLELVTDAEESPHSLAIVEDMPQGVHLIPARTDLNDLEAYLPRMVDKVRLLHKPLSAAKRSYDFIFLDTQPSAGATLTIASYAACDWFLFSVFPEPLAIAGLGSALKDIAQARKRLNRKLEILGVVIAKARRTSKLWEEIDTLIKEHLPGRGFKTTISDAVAMSRVSGRGHTLFQDKRLSKHKLADEYKALTKEIEKRCLNRESFLAGRKSRKSATTSRRVSNS